MDWPEYAEVHRLLGAGVFHATSSMGWRGIVATGAILPNDGQLQYTFPQSKGNWGVKLGGVCLFDLPQATMEQQLDTIDRWGHCATPFQPVTILLELDKTKLCRFISNRTARETVGHREFYIPYVEAWNIGPILLSAVIRVNLATSGLEKWGIGHVPW